LGKRLRFDGEPFKIFQAANKGKQGSAARHSSPRLRRLLAFQKRRHFCFPLREPTNAVLW